MSTVPQDRREVPASEVKVGQHVVDTGIPGGLGKVEHALPYTDTYGDACIALTLLPFDGGVPSMLRPYAETLIRIATDVEVEAALDGERRREFVDGLRELAAFYEAHPRLPMPRYPSLDHCVGAVDDDAGRAEITLIAAELGVEPRDDTHVRREFGPIEYRAFYNLKADMERHNADQKLLRSLKTSTGVSSPSVAGAEGGTDPAAPSGPGGRDPGPDQTAAEVTPLASADALGEVGFERPTDGADAVPVAPLGVGATGITPDRPSYDPNPTILTGPGQSSAAAYAAYATSLDSWAPGWHHDDPSGMAPGLAAEVWNRRGCNPDGTAR